MLDLKFRNQEIYKITRQEDFIHNLGHMLRKPSRRERENERKLNKTLDDYVILLQKFDIKSTETSAAAARMIEIW